MKTNRFKIISLVLLSFFIFSLSSCGTKKPEEKADHSKVDKAYEEFKEKNK